LEVGVVQTAPLRLILHTPTPGPSPQGGGEKAVRFQDVRATTCDFRS
jgi:hypothetical protein